jgi:hypothetical protein
MKKKFVEHIQTKWKYIIFIQYLGEQTEIAFIRFTSWIIVIHLYSL